MTLLLFVGGMFVFVHLSIFCDSLYICVIRFLFVRLSFLFVRLLLYLCDSVLYLCDSLCICAIRFVFVRSSCGPPYC